MSVTAVRSRFEERMRSANSCRLETDECLSTVSLDKHVDILSIAGPTS